MTNFRTVVRQARAIEDRKFTVELSGLQLIAVIGLAQISLAVETDTEHDIAKAAWAALNVMECALPEGSELRRFVADQRRDIAAATGFVGPKPVN